MKKHMVSSILLSLSLFTVSLTGCSTPAPNSSKTIENNANKTSSATPLSSESVEKSVSESSSTDQQMTAEEVSLTVFAAASMTETLTEIAALYQQEHPATEITFNFDSSGTLKTQIEEGAVCDIFISAAEKQMNQLDQEAPESANPDKLDFVDSSTRFNLVENKVVLAVPDGNPSDILSFSDIGTDKCGLIALGNDDVPVGAYSIEILEHLGLLDTLKQEQKITYGSNVKEVTTQIKEAAVDCGIIYATDAFSAELTVVDTAAPDMCRQVIYPAAVLKDSSNPDAAKSFLDFLKTEPAAAIFESVGFSMVK